MVQETKPLTFFLMRFGDTSNIHEKFLQRLKQRLHLTEVYDANNCDFIIAFVTIVSRPGTDIEAAIRNIPNTDTPVVLAALHFTFDENFVAPITSLNINRSNVFGVELLCYEDLGLLRSLSNDQALKKVTDHLISMGGSPNTQLETAPSQRPCSPTMFVCICVIFVIVIAIAIAVSMYVTKWQHIIPTQPPTTPTPTRPSHNK